MDVKLQIEDEYIRRWVKGDEDAFRFVKMFFWMCHLWDDLIDGDVERDKSDINDAFQIALLELPANRFYMKHYNDLQPVVRAAVNDWYIANTLEKKDGNALHIAYTLRCSILTILTQAAWVIGGDPWVREVGVEIREYGQRETFLEYVNDLKTRANNDDSSGN